MATTPVNHIEMFKRLAQAPLSPEEIERSITSVLAMPWVQRLMVFAEQAIIVLNLFDAKYYYSSPSLMKVLGCTREEFRDFNFLTTLMPPGELEKNATISNIFYDKLKDLNLDADGYLRTRSSRNTWLRAKDGRLVNLFQQGIIIGLNDQGLPVLQMLIVSDIATFNPRYEHFYSLHLLRDDGTFEPVLSGKLEDDHNPLSKRELEILNLVSLGLNSKQIGGRLQISTETVKTHRRTLLKKTDTRTTIDLIRHGYANGWL